MKFKVLEQFIDKETNVKYPVGSEYETDSEVRAQELQQRGYISDEIKQKEQEPPSLEQGTTQLKHVGGGYYQLPSGEKVKGKDAALKVLEGEQNDD